MNTLVIVAHPDIANSRVNRRWMEEALTAPGVTVHELYGAYPNWAVDVLREQNMLSYHDRIVLQFPFYWYSCPALLKKWFDDVLAYGWAYGPGGITLNGKEWLLAVACGGPRESYQAGGFNHYAMSELLKPFQATANLIGALYLPPFVMHSTINASEAEVEASAKAYLNHILDQGLAPRHQLHQVLEQMQEQGASL